MYKAKTPQGRPDPFGGMNRGGKVQGGGSGKREGRGNCGWYAKWIKKKRERERVSGWPELHSKFKGNIGHTVKQEKRRASSHCISLPSKRGLSNHSSHPYLSQKRDLSRKK